MKIKNCTECKWCMMKDDKSLYCVSPGTIGYRPPLRPARQLEQYSDGGLIEPFPDWCPLEDW